MGVHTSTPPPAPVRHGCGRPGYLTVGGIRLGWQKLNRAGGLSALLGNRG